MSQAYESVSRAINLVAASFALILASPLMLLSCGLILLSSPGPVLFHQERVGLRGRHFRIHKFRTMTVHAPGSGPAITAGADPRITGIGRVLRRMKLDELPQLFNVLKGDMNLVGPRPELPHYVDRYPEPLRSEVLSVPPGITDLASLTFLDESELLGRAPDPERFYLDELIPRKLELAAAYVRHRSMWLDLRIIAATLTGIFGWRWMPAP